MVSGVVVSVSSPVSTIVTTITHFFHVIKVLHLSVEHSHFVTAFVIFTLKLFIL